MDDEDLEWACRLHDSGPKTHAVPRSPEPATDLEDFAEYWRSGRPRIERDAGALHQPRAPGPNDPEAWKCTHELDPFRIFGTVRDDQPQPIHLPFKA